jgi:hypothetical protein
MHRKIQLENTNKLLETIINICTIDIKGRGTMTSFNEILDYIKREKCPSCKV